MPVEILRRFRFPGMLLFAILLAGTLGYRIIAGPQYSLLDCLYMTVITILTIGFSEIIDSTNRADIRIFTMILAFSGVLTATYIFSVITAALVEGQIKHTFKKHRIKKKIRAMDKHYIVCGAGRVGSVIVHELYHTDKPFVIIDRDGSNIKLIEEKYPDAPVIEGDATTEDILMEANIKTAGGVFAATGDDNSNLVISLTAKDINPSARVIARCLEPANHHKIRKAGADSVIIENFIAGMRMSSEMVRPSITTFLDRMFVDSEKNLRVEEIRLSAEQTGKRISDLEIRELEATLILAIVEKNNWIYNPKSDHMITADSKLVVITNPEEYSKLTEMFEGQ